MNLNSSPRGAGRTRSAPPAEGDYVAVAAPPGERVTIPRRRLEREVGTKGAGVPRERARAARQCPSRRAVRGTLLALLMLACLLVSLPGRQNGSESGAAKPVGGATQTDGGPIAFGVGMPQLARGTEPVRPLRLAIAPTARLRGNWTRRELPALRKWVHANHHPATRLTLIRPGSGRRDAQRLIGRAWTRGRGQRLLIAIDRDLIPSPSNAAVVRAHARQGAQVAPSVAARLGTTTEAEVDPSVRLAFASTAARAVISMSGMSERNAVSTTRHRKER